MIVEMRNLFFPMCFAFFFSSFPGLLCDAPQQICQCDYTNSLAPVIHHIHSMQVVLHYPVNDLHASLTSQGTLKGNPQWSKGSTL